MSRTLTEVLESVEQENTFLEDLFNKTLVDIGVPAIDDIIKAYNEEVRLAGNEGLSIFRINHYIQQINGPIYWLSASLARHSLKTYISTIFFQEVNANKFINAVGDDGKRLTKDDKEAIATLGSANEEKVQAYLKAVEKAVDSRIRALYKFNDSLKTMSMIAMSMAKLEGSY